MKDIKIKRAYEEKAYGDGYRILIDRLWPRGVSKEKAALDEWAKEITPTDELRKSVHKGEISWTKFREKYEKEIDENEEFPKWKNHVKNVLKRRHVTLVTGAKLNENGHPFVIKDKILE